MVTVTYVLLFNRKVVHDAVCQAKEVDKWPPPPCLCPKGSPPKCKAEERPATATGKGVTPGGEGRWLPSLPNMRGGLLTGGPVGRDERGSGSSPWTLQGHPRCAQHEQTGGGRDCRQTARGWVGIFFLASTIQTCLVTNGKPHKLLSPAPCWIRPEGAHLLQLPGSQNAIQTRS